MLGAIIGDIVGSVYEWVNIKTKEFPLFRPDCSFTDDTVMTVAVAEGLLKGGRSTDYITAMKKYGRLYPDAGYGGRFYHWIFSDNTVPQAIMAFLESKDFEDAIRNAISLGGDSDTLAPSPGVLPRPTTAYPITSGRRPCPIWTRTFCKSGKHGRHIS